MQALVKTKKIGIILILAAMFGCSNLEETALRYNLNVAKIENIQKQRKVDTNVFLKGKVQNMAPFLETGAYELKDATGSILVFTTDNLPVLGEEITVKGRVRYQSITPAGMGADVGAFYVEELERIDLIDETK